MLTDDTELWVHHCIHFNIPFQFCSDNIYQLSDNSFWFQNYRAIFRRPWEILSLLVTNNLTRQISHLANIILKGITSKYHPENSSWIHHRLSTAQASRSLQLECQVILGAPSKFQEHEGEWNLNKKGQTFFKTWVSLHSYSRTFMYWTKPFKCAWCSKIIWYNNIDKREKWETRTVTRPAFQNYHMQLSSEDHWGSDMPRLKPTKEQLLLSTINHQQLSTYTNHFITSFNQKSKWPYALFACS